MSWFRECLSCRSADDHGKTATRFKPEKRTELVDEGYQILGNSGDQWSDLLGSSLSIRSFKLPNPMYYIPWSYRSCLDSLPFNHLYVWILLSWSLEVLMKKQASYKCIEIMRLSPKKEENVGLFSYMCISM